MSACAACGFELSPGAKFCGSCGKSAVAPCPTCSELVPIGLKFCQSCGAEFASALAGIPLPLALEWQAQFAAMGLLQTPEDVRGMTSAKADVFISLVEQAGVPTSD